MVTCEKSARRPGRRRMEMAPRGKRAAKVRHWGKGLAGGCDEVVVVLWLMDERTVKGGRKGRKGGQMGGSSVGEETHAYNPVSFLDAVAHGGGGGEGCGDSVHVVVIVVLLVIVVLVVGAAGDGF